MSPDPVGQGSESIPGEVGEVQLSGSLRGTEASRGASYS
jgi:hypothetical protein